VFAISHVKAYVIRLLFAGLVWRVLLSTCYAEHVEDDVSGCNLNWERHFGHCRPAPNRDGE